MPFFRKPQETDIATIEENIDASQARKQLLREKLEEAQLKKDLDELHPGWRQKLGNLAGKALNADTLRQLKRGLEKSGTATHSQNSSLNPVPHRTPQGGVSNPSMILPSRSQRRA